MLRCLTDLGGSRARPVKVLVLEVWWVEWERGGEVGVLLTKQ